MGWNRITTVTASGHPNLIHKATFLVNVFQVQQFKGAIVKVTRQLSQGECQDGQQSHEVPTSGHAMAYRVMTFLQGWVLHAVRVPQVVPTKDISVVEGRLELPRWLLRNMPMPPPCQQDGRQERATCIQ